MSRGLNLVVRVIANRKVIRTTESVLIGVPRGYHKQPLSTLIA